MSLTITEPGTQDGGLQVFHHLEQGTDEWLKARCGIVTASVVGQFITPKTPTTTPAPSPCNS
jgi:hypothetical protein